MEYQRAVLPNGLRVIHVPMPQMQSTSIVVHIGLGSRYESERHAGISHLIEHMLFKGTERRPRARDISETIESVGGLLNASTDKELTLYWTKTAREHVPLALDLLSDMLQCSRIRPADLGREKGIIGEELAMLADDPQDWVHVLADEVLWPGEPLGREIAGSRDSVAGLTRRAVVRYLERYYGPNNATVSVAGGIGAEETIELVEHYLGSWSHAAPDDPVPAISPVGGDRVRVELRPIEQVNVCVVFPGMERRHPDRWALDMLSTILGGSTSSRLFVELRERLALVYDVQMYTNHYSDAGSIIVSAGMDPSTAPRALTTVLHELDRVRRRGVSASELSRAQRFFRGRLALGLEDTHAVAGWFGAQEMLQHEVLTPDAAVAAIEAVSAQDVRRVAREYLRPDLARLAVVGPSAEPALESLLASA